MKRREQAPAEPRMPEHLATFEPSEWPAPPDWWVCGDRAYRRTRWQRARQQWRKAHR